MSTEIIVVKQLPVIVEQLAQFKETVIQRVQTATSLVCTDDTVKEVKKARAELNNEFKAWEEKRKEVKTAVMTPYEQFEAVYKDCVSDTYKKADAELKAKIEGVEKELKQKKADEVKEYFNEYNDKYVLIGGAACYLHEEEFDMKPRATKDLDLILVVEVLTRILFQKVCLRNGLVDLV